MTRDEIKRIAELARLEFNESEMDTFVKEFDGIVHYVGTIEKVDLSGVEPLASVSGLTNETREDVVGECLPTNEALKNAPKKNEAFFKVPKVLG